MIIKNFGVYVLAFLLLAAPAFARTEKTLDACNKYESHLRIELDSGADDLQFELDEHEKIWRSRTEPGIDDTDEILHQVHELHSALRLALMTDEMLARYDTLNTHSWLCSIIERLEKIEERLEKIEMQR